MTRLSVPQTQNLLKSSQDMSVNGAPWGWDFLTVTGNAAVAPDGTTTAQAVVEDNTTHHREVFQTWTSLSASTYTVSVYAKAVNRSWLWFSLDAGANSSSFDLSNGVLGTISASHSNATITSFGNGWYRCSVTQTNLASGAYFLYVGPSNSTSPAASYAGSNGSTAIYIWGAQIVQANWVGTYQLTTSSIVNTGPIRNIVPQVQNLLVRSQTFDNAAWTKNLVTVTAAATTAPDGTLTGEALIATTTTSVAHYVLQAEPASTGIGQTITISVYAKAGAVNSVGLAFDGGFGEVSFTLTGAGTISSLNDGLETANSATIQALPNGWYRCSATITRLHASSNAVIYAQNVIATNAYAAADTVAAQLYLWGAQYVKANWAGPYQLTTASAINNGPIRNIATQSQNLVINSGAISSANGFSNVAASLTSNATTDPFGGNNATKLVENNTNNSHTVYQHLTGITAGIRYTSSYYIKAAERTWAFITEGNGASATCYFNLSTGVTGVILGTGSPVSQIQSIGNGWYRCSMTWTTIGTTPNIQCGAATANSGSPYTGNGSSGIYVYGAQFVQGTWQGPFQLTGSTVINNGVIRGITTQNQNLILYSQDLTQANWTTDSGSGGTAPTITGNYATAPDGTLTATRVQLTKTAGVGSFSRIQQSGIPDSKQYTFSVWLKTNDGSSKIVDLRMFSTNFTVTVTGTWQQFSTTQSTGVGNVQILLFTTASTDNSADLAVWGAQLVRANWAGNYTLTTTAIVNSTNNIRNIA